MTISLNWSDGPETVSLCEPHAMNVLAWLAMGGLYRVEPVDDPRLDSLLDQWTALDKPGRDALAASWKAAAERN